MRHITDQQSQKLLDEHAVTDARKRTQLLFIANGRPAELTRLIADDEYFATQAEIVRDARTYVSGGGYDALLVCQKYKDDRAAAMACLEAAMKVLKASTEGTSPERIVPQIERLLTAHQSILQNGNIRLQMSAAVL